MKENEVLSLLEMRKTIAGNGMHCSMRLPNLRLCRNGFTVGIKDQPRSKVISE